MACIVYDRHSVFDDNAEAELLEISPFTEAFEELQKKEEAWIDKELAKREQTCKHPEEHRSYSTGVHGSDKGVTTARCNHCDSYEKYEGAWK